MVSKAVTSAALLLWLLVAFKFVGTVRSRSAPSRWLLATVAFLATGITIFVPAVEQWVSTAIPVAQIKEPLARTAVIAAAFCGQTLLSLTGDPVSRALRWRRWGLCLTAVAVMWAMFAVGPASTTARFGSHPVHDVTMTLFILAFLTYLAYAVATVMAGCWRYARSASGVMRWGLRLISTGCGACLAYVVVKALAIIAFAAGIPMAPVVEGSLAQGLVAVGALLVVVGAAATATSQRSGELRDWTRDYLAHRRLYPLWADLATAVPGVALDPAAGPWQDASRVGDMHMRLYRRLIELRDAWLALRPFMDSDLARSAETLTPENESAKGAVVEAQMLRAGVIALSRQRPAARPWTAESSQRTSMADELAWWSAVAAAWGRQQESVGRPRTSVDLGAR